MVRWFADVSRRRELKFNVVEDESAKFMEMGFV